MLSLEPHRSRKSEMLAPLVKFMRVHRASILRTSETAELENGVHSCEALLSFEPNHSLRFGVGLPVNQITLGHRYLSVGCLDIKPAMLQIVIERGDR